jgi:hypothetical protein
VRKTVETLEAQTVRRKSTTEQNDQREDIDEAMGEGGGDEEEDGESEDDNEDGQRKWRCCQTVRNTTEKAVQLLLQNWCSGQDNYRQRS